MSDDGDLQHEVLQRTLQEVVHDGDGNVANPCVVCLDTITEPCMTVPCNHANFDFLCLASWLEQRASCPLCKLLVRVSSFVLTGIGKSNVTSVKYDLDGGGGPKIYQLPPPSKAPSTAPSYAMRPQFRRGPRPYPPRRAQPSRPTEPNDPLLRRRHVYRHQLYSLRVGSNRLSRYRELTPEHFNRDEELLTRARKWIRRELRVFTFLNPDSDEESGPERVAPPGQQRLDSRRANNAEFLLEYIIAILRTVDLKGPAGQAEELLRDFLGRENARLFLHELQAWLRSPYSSLADWDRNVQYGDTSPRPTVSGNRLELEEVSSHRSTPIYRDHRHRLDARVSKSYSPRRDHRSQSRDVMSRARILQQARDRYIPD